MLDTSNLFIQYTTGQANFCKNLSDLFFHYWLGKTKVVNDPKEILAPIYDVLNFKVMQQGMVALLLNYGKGITIASINEIWFNKNFQPVACKVDISQTNHDSPKTYKAVHWEIKKDKKYYDALMTELGWINQDSVSFSPQVVEDTMIYECIFFQNNFSMRPSLENLEKIITNVGTLDEANDKNHPLINVFYQGISDKKYTPAQLENFGYVFTPDGYGVSLTVFDGDTNNLLANVRKEYVVSSLSKWAGIKDEFTWWIDKFFDFAGIAKEKLSNQRENVGETSSRNARINMLEKEHYKYRQKFINDFNKYFNSKLQIEFDEIINTDVYQSLQPARQGQIQGIGQPVAPGIASVKEPEKQNAKPENQTTKQVDRSNQKIVKPKAIKKG